MIIAWNNRKCGVIFRFSLGIFSLIILHSWFFMHQSFSHSYLYFFSNDCSLSLWSNVGFFFLSCTFSDFTLWTLALCFPYFITMVCWLFAEYSKYTPTSESRIAIYAWKALHTALQLPYKFIQASQFHYYLLWLSFLVP